MKARLFCIFLLANCWAWAQQEGFIENKGQWDSRILFKANLPGGDLILEKNKIRYIYYDEKSWSKIVSHPHHHDSLPRPKTMNMHCVDVELPEANPTKINSNAPLVGYLNFFLGNKESQWAGHVQRYAEVTYKNLWPGIDMQWLWQGSNYKYNFIVQPGADISKIKMLFKGMESLTMNEGKLHVKTSVNEYEEELPLAWQFEGHHTVYNIVAAFILYDNLVQFKLKDYDRALGLTIDPVLVFSTYSGSSVDNFGFTAAYDSRGCLFAGGIASVPTKFPLGIYPTTAGAFQVKMAGGDAGGWEGFPCDISVSKYSPNGDSLLWATYLGGSGNEFPHSIIGDQNDNLVIFGSTTSGNFPVKANGFDTSANGNYDIICAKLSADGSQLLGSTYLGGSNDDGFNVGGKLRYNYADEFRGEVDLDSFGNIYIASCTYSPNFPVSTNALLKYFGGKLDGLILKFDPLLTQMNYGSYFGDTAEDALYSVEIASDGSVYVGGGTESINLPTALSAIHPTALGGRADGYIAHLTNDTFRILSGTYIGTPEYNQVYFIELDKQDRVYATGQTEGSFPIVGNVFSEANSGQFIQRISPHLDTLQLSTVFGLKNNKPNLNPSAFMVDYCGNVYFSGWGSDVQAYAQDLSGTTNGMAITPDAVQDSTDGEDFYILVLSKNMATRLYATYFGAKSGNNEGGDHVDGGTSRFDPKGVIYQSVCSSCPNGNQNKLSNFPTTTNAVFTNNISPRCSNASFKIDLKISNDVKAAFEPDTICLPAFHQFVNNSIGGKYFFWNFGDGSTDTIKSPTHQYHQPGSYLVKLNIIDSNSCNVIDSIEHTMLVLGVFNINFEHRQDPCDAYVNFEAKVPFANSYLWNFGDGNTDSNNAIIKHSYAQKGTYEVSLTVNKGSGCERKITKNVQSDKLDSSDFKDPNTFTPDGDGLNDCFRFAGIDTVCTTYHFWIYNRWGQELFESTNANECWPGEDPDGIRHPTGTYFYVLTLTRQSGEEEKKNGTITLLRGRH
ncbi:MAG: PKD domain-containing protein [Flavobacteriaceae bacterium]|nr:PKD domain-containing protein [Flavobacteriaceae bacterium]